MTVSWGIYHHVRRKGYCDECSKTYAKLTGWLYENVIFLNPVVRR